LDWREIFGEYAQWHSDKTAKTGFVGFGSTCLGDIEDFWAKYFSEFCRGYPAIYTTGLCQDWTKHYPQQDVPVCIGGQFTLP
jgi:hypothetical protein